MNAQGESPSPLAPEAAEGGWGTAKARQDPETGKGPARRPTVSRGAPGAATCLPMTEGFSALSFRPTGNRVGRRVESLHWRKGGADGMENERGARPERAEGEDVGWRPSWYGDSVIHL